MLEESKIVPENLDALIDEQAKKINPHTTEEEKARIKEVLTKVLYSGQTIAEAMKIPHDQLEFVYHYAVTLYKEGKFDDASKLFCFLMRLAPNDARYVFGFAASLHKLHQYEKAAAYYFAAATIDTSDPAPWVHCADCYVNLGNIDAARVFLSKAIDIAGDNPRHEKWKETATALHAIISKHEEEAKEAPKNKETES